MANKKKPSEKQEFLAQQRREQRRKTAKEEKKKHHKRKIVTTVVCCAAAVAVVAGGITWFVREKPMTQMIPVEKTEHYSVNAAEVSFYAWQIYNSYINSSTGSDSANLPDTEKPLADQNYDNDTTWEAYFTDAAQKYAENVLAYCEAADKENYEFPENISAMVKTAKEQMDFSTLPSSVTQDNITHALELYFKAQSFSTSVEENMSFTDDELESYYKENTKTMDVCSYMEFSFSYDDSGDSTTISRSEAEELARSLRRCNTKDEFQSWVYDYYAKNTSLTEEDLQSQLSTLYSHNISYTEGDDVSEWAFSGEAKAGDSNLFTDTDNKRITVCLLLDEPKRDESHPVTIRQILFTTNTYESSDGAHSAAEKALEEWNSGEQTESAFATLADQYTEDTTVSGGLYQNITEGQLSSAWQNWCFDAARKSGDVTILDSSYGSCLVYYVEAAEQAGWEMTATNALQNQRYNELQETYQKEADLKSSDWGMRFVTVNNQK